MLKPLLLLCGKAAPIREIGRRDRIGYQRASTFSLRARAPTPRLWNSQVREDQAREPANTFNALGSAELNVTPGCHGQRRHDTAARPNQMWGTDATAAFTQEDGQVTVFIAVDHRTAECVGIHAAKPGTRYEALEPIRQAIRSRFGAIGLDVAQGLSVRHDHGSQYTSDAFQDELFFFGIESSPAFVRAPEGNGCAERLIRTLKEQLLWLRPFQNVEELRLALLDWAARYNGSWLIERHGFLTPTQARKSFEEATQAA